MPRGIRETLQRPLLARIFCDLARADPGWTPINEYGLYESYWGRITKAKEQADFPHDLSKMRTLAFQILEANTVYPWTWENLRKADIDEESQRRLESVGWLRRTEENRVEIWHDRLLNWAVAEALIYQWEIQQINTEELSSFLVKFVTPRETFKGKFLHYVPMDFFWLATKPGRERQAEIPKLMLALESPQAFGAHILYEELLPTLGGQIVEALVQRVQEVAGDVRSSIQQYVGKALIQIGKDFPEKVQNAAIRLLNASVSELQQIGMRVLARIPCAAALDKLWEFHRQNTKTFAEEKISEHYFLYDASFSALRSCVQLQPQWLVEKICEVDAQEEPVAELAYLVANLDVISGPRIWRTVKAELFAKVPSDKPRGLINCIRKFKDHHELSRLECWTEDERDFAASSALGALAVLDPHSALTHLGEVPWWERYGARGWWLPELLFSLREETQTKLRQLMWQPGADIWRVAHIYQERENEMDPDTLDVFLDALDQDLRNHFDPDAGNKPQFHVSLSLLARIARRELLQRLEARAGSELEALLTDLACSWVGRAGVSFDHDLNDAKSILLKIAGTGITRLVNCEISSPDCFSRMAGLKWALCRPDTETRQIVKKILESEDLPGDKSQVFGQRYYAIRALAALGEDEALVQALLLWGIVPIDLADLRHGQLPMSDESLSKALLALDQTEEDVRAHAIFAIGVSGRKDLIPCIHNLLTTMPKEGSLPLAAMFALNELADDSSEAVRFFANQLTVPNHEIRAMNALFRIKTEESLDALEKHLLQENPPKFEHFEALLALARFGGDTSKRKAVIETIGHRIKAQSVPWFPHECLVVIGEVDSQEVQDLLWEKAFPSDAAQEDASQISAAIRGLAKFDPDAAFRAALLALDQPHRNKEILPSLLLELEPRRAIAALCAYMPREKGTLIRWAIGRALRWSDQPDILKEKLQEMLQSSDAIQRQAAAELYGWQGNGLYQDWLYDLLSGELDDKVRKTALDALQRQRSEREVHLLIEAFKSADVPHQWSYLEAILEFADPYLLGDRRDALWLWHILDDAPTSLVKHVESRHQKRLEEVQKKAQEIDRRIERSS